MGRCKTEKPNYFRPLLFGSITAMASSVVLLILFSVFMVIQNMPPQGGFYISFAIICLSAFFGGFIAAKILCSKGLIIGACVGLTYMILIALIGAAAGFAVNLFGTFFLKIILAVVFGGLGGILRMNMRHR